jgi:hypothetical protein
MMIVYENNVIYDFQQHNVFTETKQHNMEILTNKYQIGDLVIDNNGNIGVVCIKWSDGNLFAYEDNDKHPYPVVVCNWKDKEIEGMDGKCRTD